MDQKTENLKNAFEYIRKFYNEVAQMVSDVTDLMDKADWEHKESGITDGLSYSIDYPDNWMYYYIYKNFRNRKIDHYTKGLLVFFDDYMNEFPISVVCGNVIVPTDSYKKHNFYWLIEKNQGKLSNLSGKLIKLKAEIEGNIVNGSAFALPLTEIKSRQDLNEKVVTRLLNMTS